MEVSAVKTRRARTIIVVVAGALVCWVGFIALRLFDSPARVLGVAPGARLVAVSQGTLWWLGRTCSVWGTELVGGRTAEPLEPALAMGACPPDDPRFDGGVFYQLSGMGQVTRNQSGRRLLMVERNRAFALALDERYLYVGNCALRDDCQIERMPADDDPGDPILMQAGILNLANIEVDQREIFWVDRGRRKQECHNEVVDGEERLRCLDPIAARLMAAAKDEPRASERVVLANFDGVRPLLGAHHVYWLGAGGVHRVPKTGTASGGANMLVLPAHVLTGFAAAGDDVFIASDGGIFRARDGAEVRPFQDTAQAPGGVVVDAGFVYWIDVGASAVVRRRR